MRVTGSPSPDRLEVGWATLAVGCVAAMNIWPSWETIPFHVVWITLTFLYGFRVWSLSKTAAVLAAVGIATGVSITVDAFRVSSCGASSSRCR